MLVNAGLGPDVAGTVSIPHNDTHPMEELDKDMTIAEAEGSGVNISLCDPNDNTAG